MMKFCADSSSLDIECSILDIHHLVCQTPTIPPLKGSRFRIQGKMILLQNHFVQNELRQFIFIANVDLH